MVKALGLLSGGLDSILATKLMLKQGIRVEAINFVSPLCTCNRNGCNEAAKWAKKFNIPLKIVNKGDDFIKIIKKPKYGYGKNLNPCIDCRIYILKKAKKYTKKINAKFLFTGEVLDERPMSQHSRALNIIEKESKLEGLILRPLSAKLLPETIAEKKGLVNRNKLLGIRGRCRRPQIGLAKNLNIVDYQCPAGGCLLTDQNFSRKLRDLFKHKKNVKMRDLKFLKIGRHFRLSPKSKVIVGRNEHENKILLNINKEGIVLEVIGDVGPVSILQGKDKKAIEKAAELTAFYSDSRKRNVLVGYNKRRIIVKQATKKDVERLRI